MCIHIIFLYVFYMVLVILYFEKYFEICPTLWMYINISH